MTKIRSTLQAIGIITEEVRKMADKRHRNGPDECVECGARLTHPGAYFCEECAPVFYDGEEGESDE